MANTMRWRYGETNPVVLPVASATVIEIGDLLYLDTTAKPAGLHSYGASLAATQETFHDTFAGVAMQQSRAGDTQDIRVATSGVFEFACASATFDVDGSYRAQAFTNADGLVPGTYAVRVECWQTPPDEATGNPGVSFVPDDYQGDLTVEPGGRSIVANFDVPSADTPP